MSKGELVVWSVLLGIAIGLLIARGLYVAWMSRAPKPEPQTLVGRISEYGKKPR